MRPETPPMTTRDRRQDAAWLRIAKPIVDRAREIGKRKGR